ncbi:MAG: response regulator [Dehalococcoidales bacterium]|nr:response regulator [Dehalococcoidales bacterium]
MTTNQLLSAQKVAEYLDMKPITIRRKAQRGEIPSIKIGNRLRFDKQLIDKWLLSRSGGIPINILVVDDEPAIGELFKESLNRPSYEVMATPSGIEALELIDKRHFDMVFLDLVLPDLDGSKVLKHIKEIDKYTPVAIITGYPDSELLNRAMEQGPFIVIKKPFDTTKILDAVSSFIREARIKR